MYKINTIFWIGINEATCKCGAANVCTGNADTCIRLFLIKLKLGVGGVCKCGSNSACTISTDTCKIN